MKARRRLVAVAAACALALGGSVLVAAPASAKASDCKTDQFCTFLNINYEGAYTNTHPATDLRLWAGFGVIDFNDKISSVINKKNYWMDVFEHIDHRGYKHRLERGEVRSDLRYHYMPDGRNWNDKISSFW